MVNRIGDYALLGDCRSAALVARDGSSAWALLPEVRRASGVLAGERS